jgi:hypothetical protein
MLISTSSRREIMQVAIKKYTRDMKGYLAKFHYNQTIVIKEVTGEEFIEITKEVLHNSNDLMSKTAQSMGGAMAMHLLRKCPCPVYLRLMDS